ncbi:hypothetical protein CANINC_002946 [Pichia inconspicua]|uniref:tRNA N(3)-methylcytidine methyltransferase n=1 Tax=Pichia inconspicua TaxID=52247 RepID=A0A4V4NFK7_9ASCO|nr:hypothetical protein CANINC_002946 [[Candida] inconspicua]
MSPIEKGVVKPPLDSRIGRDAPFEFGQRFLDESKDVFEHNAWDNVEWDDEQISQFEEAVARQRSEPVAEHLAKEFNANPKKYWDIFYKNNGENFFKDRAWLEIEFPLLFECTHADSGEKIVLEVGCGAGNTFFPLLERNENKLLKAFACDYSDVAVELVKSNERFAKHSENGNAFASVWDLANDDNKLPEGIKEESVDIVVLVFVFSALSPEQWFNAMKNLFKCLKPGGIILFRDYGRYDLAQVRFKKSRYLNENFYVRGDGTRVYFFNEDELSELFSNNGFEVNKLACDRRLLVNRKKQLKMYRNWIQGVFQKKLI